MRSFIASVVTAGALIGFALAIPASAQLKPECRPPGYNPKDLAQCTKACQCNGGGGASHCAAWCKKNIGSR